jgi:hypothetical protein
MNNRNSSSAIELNDFGLCRLLHHEYEEASVFFRDALTVIKHDMLNDQQEVDEEQQEQQHSKIPRMEEQAEDLQDECVDIEFYEPSRTCHRFRNQFGFNNENPMICKMAIGICKNDRERPHSTSLVIYNLAITTHLWALQKGSTEKLKKALHLYKIASRAHAVQKGDDMSGIDVSFTMSMLNNVASIHFTMGNHKDEVEILRQLWAVMTHCGKQESTKSHEKIWKICQRNVLTLLMAPPSTACAA